MYQVAPGIIVNRIATEALAAHRLVIFSTDDTAVEYPAAQFDAAYGVTMHEAALGEQVDVCILGPCLVKVDGNATNIVAMDKLTTHDAAGIAQKIGSTANTVYPYVGYALGAATADGALISVFVNPATHSTAT